MTTKNLFDKGKSYKVLSSIEASDIVKDAESTSNIEQTIIDRNRFIPNVDFSSASNFVRYGSAEKYYTSAFQRIMYEYPYDGSSKEKQEFVNNSSYLDLYLLDNAYPKTTGYITLSKTWGTRLSTANGYGLPSVQEYISFFGTLNTASSGMVGKPLSETFDYSNRYETDVYERAGVDDLGRVGSRTANLLFDTTRGMTVEFWLKKNSFITSLTEKEVIFDLWNGQTSGSTSYGRYTIFLSGSSATGSDVIKTTIGSGTLTASNFVSDYPLWSNSAQVTSASVADNTWHHYAFTLKSDSTNTYIKNYIDGILANTATIPVSIGEVTGSLRATIGSLITSPSGSAAAAGAGKLSGSLDEFRFWKTERTHEQIAKNYFSHVDGGTNTDISNTELGVYYKFNEGITGDSTLDSVILDYSGRATNARWIGYPGSGSRNTGSAMVESGVADIETPDPIIYIENPLVSSKKAELVESGSTYDQQNNTSIYYTMPTWIIEEDQKQGELANLTQIVGSYFDTLHAQIEQLPRLKDASYVSASYKPLPFSNRLLENMGLFAPEIFVDASLLEQIKNQSEKEIYQNTLSDIKNMIYQNIYNNLVYIYKSKGTEKSFRNLVRCYGVDEELIKINLYGNNVTYKMRENFNSTVVKKKYIDFNHPDRFGATVTHQTSSTNVNTFGITYVTGSYT